MKSLNSLVIQSRDELLANWGDRLRLAFSGAAWKNPADLTRLNVDLTRMRTRGTLKASFAETLRLLKKRVVAAV